MITQAKLSSALPLSAVRIDGPAFRNRNEAADQHVALGMSRLFKFDQGLAGAQGNYPRTRVAAEPLAKIARRIKLNSLTDKAFSDFHFDLPARSLIDVTTGLPYCHSVVNRWMESIVGTVEDVKRLADAGKTVREIAEELGVTRQRISFIGRSQGIRIAHKRFPARDVVAPDTTKGCGSGTPRLLTGGAPIRRSTFAVGAVSELLVAADLIARGWTVFMPIYRSRGHDILASRDRSIISIEVRSAYRNAFGKLIFSKRPEDCSDYYGIVVTGEAVIYEPELPS